MQPCIILFCFLIDLSPLLLANITCSWRQRLRRQRRKQRSTSQLLHPPPPQGIPRSICRNKGLPWRRPDKIPYIQVETILLMLQTQRALFFSSNTSHPNLHPPTTSRVHYVTAGGGAAAYILQTTGSRSAVEGKHNSRSQLCLAGVGFFYPYLGVPSWRNTRVKSKAQDPANADWYYSHHHHIAITCFVTRNQTNHSHWLQID